ncbi:MAG TPA: FlgD immunoglobulin-like domain containing protein [bacterium]|nr:FlgD immunoglobulin-like domain containing protein [bacterium]HPN44826.1 FlgD immunoglobulin-like domain containing protein [bacterium]
MKSQNYILATLIIFLYTIIFLIIGTPVTGIAAPGNALAFDGVDDYVTTADIDNALTGFTIEAWVKWNPSITTDVQFICGKGVEQLELHTGGGAGANGLRFIPVTGVYLDAATVLPTGQWTHIAAVYNPATSVAKLYVNGIEETLTNNGPNPLYPAVANTAIPFYIGRRSDNMYYFKGMIDEVRVWNTVRSQAQIQQYMDIEVSPSAGGLIEYHDFNEGTPGGNNAGVTNLPDLTSNNYDGTLYNFALTGSTSNWVAGFITKATVTTDAAANVSADGATLNGTVNANNASTTVTFEYGLTTGYGSTVTADESPVTGGTATAVSYTLTGLLPGTTYHYRAVGVNSKGTTNGDDVTFDTDDAAITFTDGSAFTPAITLGSANQVIGRFTLSGDVAGAALTAASIKLNGTRTGLSNLKLWSSADATFESGSDTQLGSTVAADPGDGGSASFSGFTSSIATGGTYYFLTGDVAAGATGIVQGIIVANANLSFFNATLSGTITNAPLSNGDASLPVELTSFTATVQGNAIVLSWQTATETDNLGFILERSVGADDNPPGEAGTGWQTIASYQTRNELKGQGNTSSRTEYAFTDQTVESGKSYSYRLSDVSTKGKITVYASLSITMDNLPETTELGKAYPNPFNPQTFIGYELAEDTDVTIRVFDMLGRQVKTLFNGHQFAGSYNVYWNATDERGNKVPSGSYIIQMKTKTTRQTQKVMLMK